MGIDCTIPTSWANASLEDVCTILDGVREPVNAKDRSRRIAGKDERSLYPYYGATGCVGHIDGYLFDGEYVLIGEDGAPFLDSQRDKAYVATGKFWVNNHAHILRAHVSAKYLCYYLNSIDYSGHVTGTTRLKLTQAALRQIPVAFPPANEQKRIVVKIEELFSEIDKVMENLEITRNLLERYRASVLHRAVHDWDGKPYPTMRLDELIGPISQGWSPKCDANRMPHENEWAVIKTTAVQPMAYIPNECKPLPNHNEPRPGIEIRNGDLLMTRKGPRARTGVVCHVKEARPRTMLCDTVYRFRCHEEIVLPEYLEIALNSPSIVQEIDSRKSGINDSGISVNHGRIKSVFIPVPRDKALQDQIVQRARQRISIAEHMDSIIREQMRKCGALRFSILRQAFSGQLVMQDENDEPACFLLERIAAKRQKDSNERKKDNRYSSKKEAA